MFASLKKTYRRLRYGEPIVVVSGLPRSGTSMAMKMLEAGGGGVVVDGLRTADEDNPKGYYEDERVKDLAREIDKSWLVEARGKVIKVISFLLKELPETNNYQVIFMRRDLREVLASQAKMLERRGESSETEDERMLELWGDHLWKVNRLLRRAPHLEAIEIPYRDAVENPRQMAAQIRDFLGLDLDVEKMTRVVDAKLYRNRAPEKS